MSWRRGEHARSQQGGGAAGGGERPQALEGRGGRSRASPRLPALYFPPGTRWATEPSLRSLPRQGLRCCFVAPASSLHNAPRRPCRWACCPPCATAPPKLPVHLPPRHPAACRSATAARLPGCGAWTLLNARCCSRPAVPWRTWCTAPPAWPRCTRYAQPCCAGPSGTRTARGAGGSYGQAGVPAAPARLPSFPYPSPLRAAPPCIALRPSPLQKDGICTGGMWWCVQAVGAGVCCVATGGARCRMPRGMHPAPRPHPAGAADSWNRCINDDNPDVKAAFAKEYVGPWRDLQVSARSPHAAGGPPCARSTPGTRPALAPARIRPAPPPNSRQPWRRAQVGRAKVNTAKCPQVSGTIERYKEEAVEALRADLDKDLESIKKIIARSAGPPRVGGGAQGGGLAGRSPLAFCATRRTGSRPSTASHPPLPHACVLPCQAAWHRPDWRP